MTNPIRVNAPASKSVSHRMLICAALADGESVLTGILDSDDLDRTIGCLRAMGADIQKDGGAIRVVGVAGRPTGGDGEPADFYMHESGTTCRLMTGVAAAGTGTFRIHGVQRMHERPIGALTAALESAGTWFRFEDTPGFPPFVMEAAGLHGGEIAVDAGESSQYLSGILLAAPCATAETIVALDGEKVVSWPYVALTLQAMHDFGISFAVEVFENGDWKQADWKQGLDVAPGTVRFRVQPGRYRAGTYRAEGDWSNASYFAAAGAVGSASVVIEGVRRDSLQGDREMVDILERMGAQVHWDENSVTVAAPKDGVLEGIAVDMASCPDIVPTVAVAAAFAASPTTVTGAAHLRIKECDRLEVTAGNLRRAGQEVEVTDDGLVVTPRPMTGGEVAIETQADHRMAMSSAILRLGGFIPVPDDPGCVKKSFPKFWDEWEKVAD